MEQRPLPPSGDPVDLVFKFRDDGSCRWLMRSGTYVVAQSGHAFASSEELQRGLQIFLDAKIFARDPIVEFE